MASGLPPPPTRADSGDFVWVAWYNQLNNYLSTGGSVAWSVINKAGSSLGDLQIKTHELLTSVQGGTSGEHYHLTSTEYTGTGTGVFVRKDAAQFTGATTFTGTLQPTTAGGYKSSDGSVGYTGTVTTASLVGKTITIKDGLIVSFA